MPPPWYVLDKEIRLQPGYRADTASLDTVKVRMQLSRRARAPGVSDILYPWVCGSALAKDAGVL